MAKPGQVQITSTSDRTAEVTPPIVLRDGERKRLVFTPVLVDNPKDPAAAVRGELEYQSKNAADQWERDKPFDLRTLPAGQSIRLELGSAELLQFYNCVGALYELMSGDGFEYGTKRLLSIDAGTDLAEILDSISAIGQDDQVKRVLGWMARQDSKQIVDALQHAEPEVSSQIAIAAGLARLRGFIEEANAELDNSDEKRWQKIIECNVWAIGQIFSHPLVMVKREAFLGGKSIHNTGGNNADFVLRNQVTGNALIVEMKTPATPLTGNKTYRNNAFAPSKELGGAVQQVLQDLYSLRQSYSSLLGDKPAEFRVFRPKLLLIIGNLSREVGVDRVRSFELFRNSIPDIQIVTFDELLYKAQQLLDLFEDAT